MSKGKKFYCYVDETGQDTSGTFFIVGLLVLSNQREELEQRLKTLEEISKKRQAKWTDAYYLYRRQYISGLLNLNLSHTIFSKHFSSGKEYLKYTADAIVVTLRTLEGEARQATVYVDGFPLAQVQDLKRQLKPSLKMRIYVKTIARDESSAFMRLADAICGLVRDGNEGNAWSQKAIKQLKEKGFLKSL